MSHSPIRQRVSAEGLALGKLSARLANQGAARLQALGLNEVQAPMLRENMCKTCACRPGSVPNGCLQTQMDLLKAAHEGLPFRCHSPADGRICTGWLHVRAEIAQAPLPSEIIRLLEQWEYSPEE